MSLVGFVKDNRLRGDYYEISVHAGASSVDFLPQINHEARVPFIFVTQMEISLIFMRS